MKPIPHDQEYISRDLHAFSGRPGMSSLSKDLKSFFSANPFAIDLLGSAAMFFLLIDFSRMEYIYVSEGIVNVLGYSAAEWRGEGLAAAFRTVYHEDKARLKKLHQDLFAFHFSTPMEQRRQYRYTSDFRAVRKDGKIIWMLSQSSIIGMDDNGNAAIGFETCSDVTHIKKDNTMTLSITRSNSAASGRVEKRLYYPLAASECFTSREIEVLHQLQNGLTSKQIADALSISKLTVSKHRTNMMRKAHVSNSAGLIHYARENNLL